MSDPRPQLRVEHLRKEYAGDDPPRVVLQDVSFTLAPAETLAVMGPSGVGKSTLLHLLGSLDRPTAGRVLLGDTCVTELPEAGLAAFRARSVGFVFQDHHLLPHCTALENVMTAALARARCVAGPARDRCAALLERVGLGGRMDAFPAELSGGERQRVAVARALVNDPLLLLADEPTGNLDAAAGEGVVGLFLELAAQRGVMTVMATHNAALAAKFGRCAQLRDGALHETPGAGRP
jgi:lipoprotein-releasing system ATP-binding protein